MSDQLFRHFCRVIPETERTFLKTPEGENFTYGDLLERTARLANALGMAGVRPDDRVAVQVERSPQAVFLYLACLRAGFVYLPLNPAYTQTELSYFVNDAEPALIVCDPGRESQIAALGPPTLTLDAKGAGSLSDAAANASDQFADCPHTESDLAAILYTSGTTGRSKGAMLTLGNLTSNAQTLAGCWRFTEDDVLLHALPIYHAHGLFVAINTVLAAGASMLWLPRFDADSVLGHLSQATVMMGVPTFYTRLLAHPGLTRETAGPMRLFVSGSAPLLAETHRQWQDRTGHAILERYGLTETLMNTSNPYDGERRPGTVGFPLQGVSLRIQGGEIGMIEVKGPNVCKGYWRNPEKTAQEFKPDGYFITGDLGRIDAEGYVHIEGRAKDLVITGGFNVYPKEIESEIDALPGVLESAVFGVAHPDFGEAVTAAVVSKSGQKIDEKAILKALEARLAKFKLPKRVFIVPELPRNSMGKVQKNLLRETYKKLYI